MPRTISSAWTFGYKYVGPIFTLIFGVFMAFQILPGAFGSGDPVEALFFLLLIALLAVISLWSLIKLKKVGIDNNFLYISSFGRETRIPVQDIYDVTENRWIKFHPVTIHLKKPSEFGTEIVFAHTYRTFGFFTSHPIVDELKQLARSKSLTGFLINPSLPKMFD